MMRKFSFISSCVVLCCLLGACTKPAPVVEGSIYISPSENLQPVLEAYPGSCSVKFSATADWTASIKNAEQNQWLTVSPTSGGSGDFTLKISVTENNDQQRTAVVELRCGEQSRKIYVTQNKDEFRAKGFPAVWDFYALGFDNTTKGEALEHPSASRWKSELDHPTLKTTFGNPSAYMQVYAKEGLYEKSGMKVTLNPGIQACGLLENDYYEFVIPVENFSPQTELSVYGATGGKNVSVAFWTLEYSADGISWYAAPDARKATEGSVTTNAHFWNTPTTVDSKRTIYYASADDSFHFYRFCCSKLSSIANGELHLRLRAQKYSGKFDGSTVEKGWSDIKAFHVYLASDKPNPLMKIVAHRGGYLENRHPENSRAALKATLAQNCCGSECDIMWTVDGDLVVAHPDDNNFINNLIPSQSTLEEIRKSGLLRNGETFPSFKDYLDIIMDDTLNPYGAQIWVDVKWITQELSDKAVDLALAQAKQKGALDRIILMIKNPNYVARALEIKNKYGVDVAWNGKITVPAAYGIYGWAQVRYTDYFESDYWPPTTYSNAGVQISIFNCSSNIKEYEPMYENALQYYDVMRAIFVNHPMDLAKHLVKAGCEK